MLQKYYLHCMAADSWWSFDRNMLSY